MENKKAQWMVGALNLFAVGLPLFGTVTAQAAPVAKGGDQKIAQVNAASLKSIERTWLEVPHSCKARGFNASPVALVERTAAPRVQSIYASFEA